MQLRDFERLVGEVDPGDLRAALRHAFSEYAAAAAYIERAFSTQCGNRIDIVQPQWIDIVQRLEVAVGVPPMMGKLAELGDFGRVDVDAHCAPMRSRQKAALARISCVSMVVKLRSSSTSFPLIQTWLTCSRPA